MSDLTAAADAILGHPDGGEAHARQTAQEIRSPLVCRTVTAWPDGSEHRDPWQPTDTKEPSPDA